MSEVQEKDRIYWSTGPDHLRKIWECMGRVVGAEIPNNADRGLIMEAMSSIGKQFDYMNHEGIPDEQGQFEVSLDIKAAKAAWHCCNVVINNKMTRGQNDQIFIIENLSLLAGKIDDFILANGSQESLLVLD